MAIVSNTFLTYSAKGIREDLSNIITNIAPEETPYMSNIGRENVSNSLFEWQTDTLASAAANAQLEGDDVASFDSVAQKRTGVTDASQGLDPAILQNVTAAAVASMQAAGAGKVELIARIFAETGVKSLFKGILHPLEDDHPAQV